MREKCLRDPEAGRSPSVTLPESAGQVGLGLVRGEAVRGALAAAASAEGTRRAASGSEFSYEVKT
jgi:hypothetical protein